MEQWVHIRKEGKLSHQEFIDDVYEKVKKINADGMVVCHIAAQNDKDFALVCFCKVKDATKASHGNSQINPAIAIPKYKFYKKALGNISTVCGGPG